MFEANNKKSKRGQVILLSVMVLGGVMISATVIAGLLTRFQVRQVNDAVSSAKAVFVADSVVEAVSLTFFKRGDPLAPASINCPTDNSDIPLAPGDFDDASADFNFECRGTPPPNETLTITAEGFSGRTARILESFFSS